MDATWNRGAPPFSLAMSVTLNTFSRPEVIDEAQPMRAVIARPMKRVINKGLKDGPRREMNRQAFHSSIRYAMAELQMMSEQEPQLNQVNAYGLESSLQVDCILIYELMA